MKKFSLILLILAVIASVIFFSNEQTNSSATPIPSELKNLSYAIYPTSPNYNKARFNFNKRFDVHPHAIIMPRTQQEASFILTTLKKHQLEFSVRGGGHCYEPASLSPGYIFDLSNFNAITPNIAKEEVFIGAGCRLGDVITALGALGFAIPTGTCPRVGVAGLALGGGIGMLSRTYGLTCDSIKSITFLDANAQIVEVSDVNQPDLFWALRGAGNNSYGIALGFTFKMVAIPVVTYYEYSWDWDPAIVPKIIKAWQTWSQQLDDTISSQLRIRYSFDKTEIGIAGLKFSSEEFTEGTEIFKDLKPKITQFKGRYVESKKYWAENPQYAFCKMKSKIINEPFSDILIEKMVSFFERLNGDKAKQHVLFDFDAMGGKIPSQDTAFFPRNALCWWYMGMYWNEQDQATDAMAYIQEFYAGVSPDVSPYSYANTVDYDVGANFLEIYYGDKADRLIEIKKKYDPTNLFHWKQSIPLE